jgi:hypothetical protein
MADIPISEKLLTPTADLVESECHEFDSMLYNELGENALRQLRGQFPRNIDPAQVLLKVIVLNKLYSTRVNDIDVWPLAEHIAGLRIDSLIDQGDPAAVKRIYTCGDMRMYYSFATKFCSLHNPTAYPIYDRYADECLWAYKKQDRFEKFDRQDLGYYNKFVAVVSAFRKHYGLDRFSFRDIDKFLWRTGARILGNRPSPD